LSEPVTGPVGSALGASVIAAVAVAPGVAEAADVVAVAGALARVVAAAADCGADDGARLGDAAGPAHANNTIAAAVNAETRGTERMTVISLLHASRGIAPSRLQRCLSSLRGCYSPESTAENPISQGSPHPF
jgi:hypothetical protein